MNTALIILLIFVVTLNLKATYVLLSSSYYDVKQKIIQSVLIWILPIIGAVLVWSLAIDRPTKRISTDLNDRGGNDDGHIRLDNYSSEGGGSDAGSSD